MRVSVVINTYNRVKSLKNTLESLRYQTNNDFEVIVVNGPSTDGTEQLLSQYAEYIKVYPCTIRNLSISRNIGIEQSSGDIVAFIDDDAIAEPNWISDLINAYEDNDIGGCGGLVYDHTGCNLQYKYSSCDRTGKTDYSIIPPFDEYNSPKSEKFLYLQGTNCSFKKKALVDIGGFDEVFEYYLDEVDVCMRMIDKGYVLLPLDRAIVYHKYIESFLRNDKRVVTHPYSTVKNRFYFALKNKKENSLTESELANFVSEVRSGGEYNYKVGNISRKELNIYLKEVEQGISDGRKQAALGNRIRRLEDNICGDFLPYATIKPNEKRLKICYLSNEYPPLNFGGIGRYTYDLANEFAQHGHEVHVITCGKDHDTVDFEDGVWVHRQTPELYNSVAGYTLGWNISLQFKRFCELQRINKISTIDIVNGPIWLCETGVASMSNLFPVLTTLMTTQRIVNDLKGDKPSINSHEYKMVKFEENTLFHQKYIHAISSGILSKCNYAIDDSTAISYIQPLGCRDLSIEYPRTRFDNNIVIFSAGRIENRKGVDTWLDVAVSILKEKKYDNVYFIWAGRDAMLEMTGDSPKAQFERQYKDDRYFSEHIRFLGEVTEDELMQNYSNADITCTPSRYESFGIVLLEAMSFSNAIIASNIGGMNEIIEDGKTGLLFEVDNKLELKEKLISLIENPNEVKTLQNNARRQFEDKYKLNVVYYGMYSMYCNVINDNTRGCKEDFDFEGYSKIVALSENVADSEAKSAVKDLIDITSGECDGKEHSYNSRRSFSKSVFGIIKRVSPSTADKIRNHYSDIYSDYINAGGFRRLRLFIEDLINVIYRIPILGCLIKYIVNIIKIPINMYQICEKLNNISRNIDYSNTVLNSTLEKYESEIMTVGSYYSDIFGGINKLEICVKGVSDSIEPQISKLDEDIKQIRRDFCDSGQNIRTGIDKIYEGINIAVNGISKMPEGNDLLAKTADVIEKISSDKYFSLYNRINMVRSEILFELQRQLNEKHTFHTRVVNKEKLELQRHDYRINIGCGHDIRDEYINVDVRELEGVDIVADASFIPIDEQSVIEIYASHIAEHFPRNVFIKTIIPYWYTLLQAKGKIRMVMPDIEAMLAEYLSGTYEKDDLIEALYGQQEYEGDTHFTMYFRSELKEILTNAGFSSVYFNFWGRENGKCFDMEIEALK